MIAKGPLIAYLPIAYFFAALRKARLLRRASPKIARGTRNARYRLFPIFPNRKLQIANAPR
jgi:hypothetical protein